MPTAFQATGRSHSYVDGFKCLSTDVAVRFSSEVDWQALEQAEQFCREHDLSMGPIEPGHPRALMKNRKGMTWGIKRWSELTQLERRQVHGAMIANTTRKGPWVVRIRKQHADIRFLNTR